MTMLSEDDLNLWDLTDEELNRAWDLWFDIAQTTNAWDPAYSHGVFVGMESTISEGEGEPETDAPGPPRSRA
jgi:hypothetical protein